MICPELSCIFLHSVKTAGTSVEKWLSGPDIPYPPPHGTSRLYGYDSDLQTFLQHTPAAMTRDLVGTDVFHRSYRFTVVRNPFSRLVSMYFYPFPKTQEQFGSFDGLIRALPELVKAATPKNYYYLPQTAYAYLDGAACCDEVVHLEDLPASLDPVAAHLGITRPLPFLNVIPRAKRGSRPASSFYTPETARIVAEVYADDYAAFGYSTDVRDADAVPVVSRSSSAL